LNILRIFVLNQCVFILSINFTTKEKQLVLNFIKIDDNNNNINNKEEILSKIKINALDKYYKDKIKLKN